MEPWLEKSGILVLDGSSTPEAVEAALIQLREALPPDLDRLSRETLRADVRRSLAEQCVLHTVAMVDAALEPPPAAPAARTRPRPSQATELVDLALREGFELWRSPSGEPYATVPVDGHREHHRLQRAVRDSLARTYYSVAKHVPSSAALTDALATLSGMARHDGEEHAVSVRVAGHESAVYVDLGDSTWRAIEITAGGWQVVCDPPVRYWRPRSLRTLPAPVSGGTLDALRDLWRVDDHTWTLLASWVVAALSPRGPYPILIEIGEQGSGKSTLGRMLRGLIDPASPELRGVPRDERDVMIGALTSHVVALDNLSGLPAWLSDALCRVATGGGLATRTLYSDLDETLIDVVRPILLTGIDQPATRGDLLDRALVVTLPAIDDRERGDEVELWNRYSAMRPATIGAVCDAVSCALARRQSVMLTRRPRMADACVWVTAAEPALGWRSGLTVDTWLGAREGASVDLVGLDPVGQALIALMERPGIEWRGTATDLLAALGSKAPDGTRVGRPWPGSARGLVGRLRCLASDLRRIGLDVVLPAGARTARERVITIRRACDEQDRSDAPDDKAHPAGGSCPVGVPPVRPHTQHRTS